MSILNSIQRFANLALKSYGKLAKLPVVANRFMPLGQRPVIICPLGIRPEPHFCELLLSALCMHDMIVVSSAVCEYFRRFFTQYLITVQPFIYSKLHVQFSEQILTNTHISRLENENLWFGEHARIGHSSTNAAVYIAIASWYTIHHVCSVYCHYLCIVYLLDGNPIASLTWFESFIRISEMLSFSDSNKCSEILMDFINVEIGTDEEEWESREISYQICEYDARSRNSN